MGFFTGLIFGVLLVVGILIYRFRKNIIEYIKKFLNIG